MVTIIFESHATTTDNEKHLSSGHNDVALSKLGEQQAEELGIRYKNETFDVIFCSDLQRAYKTAAIAFSKRNIPIMKDKRLRECDYGDLTLHPCSEVDPKRPLYISVPFPNGESYKNTSERMHNFLSELKKNYNGKKVMIIGHRATQYGLEHCIKRISLKKIIIRPWKWQPGWVYKLK